MLGKIKAVIQRMTGAKGGIKMPIERQIFETIGTGVVTSAQIEGTWAQKIVEFLKNNPEAAYRANEIAKGLNASDVSLVYNKMTDLVKEGFVDKHGVYYAVTTKGLVERPESKKYGLMPKAIDKMMEVAFVGTNIVTASSLLDTAKKVEAEFGIRPSKNSKVSPIIAIAFREGRLQKLFTKVK